MKEELFKQLLSKRDEYFQCVAFMHFRGIRDVKEETIEILKKLIVEGVSGRELKTYLKTSKIKFDVYFKSCIRYLKENQ